MTSYYFLLTLFSQVCVFCRKVGRPSVLSNSSKKSMYAEENSKHFLTLVNSGKKLNLICDIF